MVSGSPSRKSGYTSVTGVSHVKRPGGIGADELDLDGLALAHAGSAVAFVFPMDGRQNRPPGSGCDEEVDEAGPRDLGAIVSLVTHNPREPEHYKALLKGFAELRHVTIEVNHCEHEPCISG